MAAFPHLWTSQQLKIWTKKHRTEVAASSSSVLSTLITYPLDSLKTRIQVHHFESFRDCVRATYRIEGIRGYWRGVLSPLASVTLVRTISFTVYQKSKYTFDRWIYNATGSSPLVIANTKGATPNLLTIACFGAAGATAGAAVTAIACPFELVKLSAQTQQLPFEEMLKSGTKIDESVRRSYEDKGTLRTAQNLIRHRGFMGLYSGFRLHMLRDSIGTAIYFVAYESVKQFLANARGNSPTTPTAVVIAGGLCGLISWACIYPIDTAKSIYQRNCLSSHKDSTTVPRIQYHKYGVYRGLGVSMARSSILNAIFFSTFEYSKKRINRLEIDEAPRTSST